MSMAEAKSVFDEIAADIVDAGQGVSHAKVREWLRSSLSLMNCLARFQVSGDIDSDQVRNFFDDQTSRSGA
jgi:hypothetical protein